MTTANNIPTTTRVSYTGRDFESLLASLEAYVAATRPDLQTDFAEAGLGAALVEIAALVGDQIAFAQDFYASEVYLATAQRYESALRFCRSVGYVPRTAAAATATLASTGTLPSALRANGGTVPAGTTARRADGTTYATLAATAVAPGATAVTLAVTEGAAASDAFDPTLAPGFAVTTSGAVVADGSWAVTVGGATWSQVVAVALETSATHAYEVSFDGDGHMLVTFGDGTAGAIPAAEVVVAYRTTAGAAGNATPGALAGVVRANVAGGGTATFPVANLTSATGGADRESLAELRVNVPAYVRSGGALTTIGDYDAAPRRVAGVALSYADFAYASYAANVVNVSVWGSEDVTFTAESDGGALASNVPYSRYGVAGGPLAAAVQAYLRDRTHVGVLPVVLTPGVAWVDLYLRNVTVDPRLSPAAIHAGIAAAVVGAFEASGGFGVRLADLYAAVSGVPGVRYFTLDRVVFEYPGKARAAGTVAFAGGAQPADGDRVIVADGAASYAFEFDADGVLSGGTVPVHTGSGAHDTMANLVAAVNAATARIVAVKTSSSVPTMTLTQRLGGAAFNLPIVGHSAVVAALGMSGGSDALSTVREDRRADPSAGAPWPPGTYAPGAPFATGVWHDGGLPPYAGMSDVTIPLARLARPYYDQAAAGGNGGIVYAGVGDALALAPAAVNLRRLVVDVVPGA